MKSTNKQINFLVPIDFSETSLSSMNLAITWSNELNAKITFLHSYRLIANSDSKTTDSPREIKSNLEKDVLDQFEKIKKRVDLSNAFKWEFRLEIGFLHHCIKSVAEKEDVDLIIYSMKNEHSPQFHETFLKIIRRTQTPILLIQPSQIKGNNLNLVACRTTTNFIEREEGHTNRIAESNQYNLLIYPPNYSKQEISNIISSLSPRLVNFG
ncbi:MAG: universal stress protein [Reichenbachiella sp.]